MFSKHTYAPFNSYKILTPRTGPVASGLDTVVNKDKITPQAYHGRSFEGNHCHQYLPPNVFTDLTEAIIKQNQTLTDKLFLIDEAHTIHITFSNLNSAFRTVNVYILGSTYNRLQLFTRHSNRNRQIHENLQKSVYNKDIPK